jgi:hypothetical protein
VKHNLDNSFNEVQLIQGTPNNVPDVYATLNHVIGSAHDDRTICLRFVDTTMTARCSDFTTESLRKLANQLMVYADEVDALYRAYP